jgi:hypothetical protein
LDHPHHPPQFQTTKEADFLYATLFWPSKKDDLKKYGKLTKKKSNQTKSKTKWKATLKKKSVRQPTKNGRRPIKIKWKPIYKRNEKTYQKM